MNNVRGAVKVKDKVEQIEEWVDQCEKTTEEEAFAGKIYAFFFKILQFIFPDNIQI